MSHETLSFKYASVIWFKFDTRLIIEPHDNFRSELMQLFGVCDVSAQILEDFLPTVIFKYTKNRPEIHANTKRPNDAIFYQPWKSDYSLI